MRGKNFIINITWKCWHFKNILIQSNNFQVECKTIIFVDTKRKADELTHGMRTNGWPALCIHGDKSQSERNWVMNGNCLKLF